MDSTSSQLPVCVYCGTARPADETSCPTCGRSWIDVRVGELAAGGAVPAAASTANAPAGDEDSTEELIPAPTEPVEPATTPPPPPPPSPEDTGEFSFDDWTLPPERPRSRARWIVPIILLLAVIAVWVLVFLDGESTPTTTVAAATTTEAPTTSTTAATTTTAVTTTTTEAPTTTTTIATPPPSVWPPIGDAIPTDELVLRAEGIGPLDIGSGIGQIAGRLTASLGEAEASGTDDVCEPEAYWLQWGDLRVFFDGFESGSTFLSYRYEDSGSETDLGLTTLSGLALGDTVADLQSIYSSFTIAFEVVDGRDVFRLVDGADLLLWGPVTGTEPDAQVVGIYSPGPCVDA